MKKRELLERLKDFPDDSEVYVSVVGDDELYWLKNAGLFDNGKFGTCIFLEGDYTR